MEQGYVTSPKQELNDDKLNFFYLTKYLGSYTTKIEIY